LSITPDVNRGDATICHTGAPRRAAASTGSVRRRHGSSGFVYNRYVVKING
jgi:hypothetical protein